ncbi:synapse-associated protein of 47 kDa [Caerostris darwini]|uniref:Synapse-associated protein of 47 kDa n=1 Tax=Caerostris darwini TaxID=1538125 RepID=A0AAV4MGV3_9ARAC|nr:synapse-associated protein of 47 kDa [Caerostris darwini]
MNGVNLNSKISANGETISLEEETTKDIDAESLKSSTVSEDLEKLKLTESSEENKFLEFHSNLTTSKELGCKSLPSFRNMKNVSIHAMESMKTIGSFISYLASNTNQSISNTAQSLKAVILNNNILEKLKETDNFLNSEIDVKPPWVGTTNEEETKKLILSLSEDEKIFLRSPPQNVFEFSLDENFQVAKMLLKEDPLLRKVRFELVPKRIKEENFWRNYFYRISLITKFDKFKSFSAKCEFRGEKSESDLSLVNENLKNQNEEKLNYGEGAEMTSLETDEQNEIKKEKIHEPQKEDSYEKISEKEIQELFCSSYLNDSNEEIGGENWETELDEILKESEDLG